MKKRTIGISPLSVGWYPYTFFLYIELLYHKMNNNSKKIKDILKNIEKSYITTSKQKEERQNDYMSKLQVFNQKSGQLVNMSYDMKKDYKNKYIDLIQRSIYIQTKSIEEYLECCLFITLTNNSEYHPYTDNNSNFNKRYENKSINDSYENLNKFWRNVYKEFSRQKIKYRFIKVFEMHKSFQPHLHLLLFVSKNDYKKVIEIIERVGNITSKEIIKKINEDGKPTNKILYNGNYKKNRNNKIGRFEVENIEDIQKGTSYLSKYIKKQFENSPYLLDGWKSKNKIRLVSTSNIDIPKYVYKIVNRFIPNEIKQNNNSLNYIIENTYMKTIFKNKNEIERVNEFGKLNSIYQVEVIKKIRNIEIENIEDLLNDKEIIKTFLKNEIGVSERNLNCNIEIELDLISLYEEEYFLYCLEILKTKKITTIENIKVFMNGKEVYNKEDFILLGDYTKSNNNEIENIEPDKVMVCDIVKRENILIPIEFGDCIF